MDVGTEAKLPIGFSVSRGVTIPVFLLKAINYFGSELEVEHLTGTGLDRPREGDERK